MLLMLGLLVGLVLLSITSLLWGVDSRDTVNSPEWTRRRDWSGFH